MWKTKPVFHIPTPPTTTADFCQTKRYTNIPLGTKDRSGHKYKPLVTSMAATFERWGNRWLKHASAAGWFAYFLRTESGQLLLEQGVKQLGAVVDSLQDDDWHRHDLGAMLTEVLSLCWTTRQKEVENEGDLRQKFLHVLAVLCARQIPEALHLRNKVSDVLVTSRVGQVG